MKSDSLNMLSGTVNIGVSSERVVEVHLGGALFVHGSNTGRPVRPTRFRTILDRAPMMIATLLLGVDLLPGMGPPESRVAVRRIF